MARKTRAGVPSLTHHKASGQAVVRLDGKDRYLGKYGTEAAQEAYDRLIARWLALGRQLPEDLPPAGELTVSELLLQYWRFAKTYYPKGEGPSSEQENIRYAVRPLRKHFGHTLAKDFGPRALKTLRQLLIQEGLCRNVVNARVGRVKRVFRWGVENELVPPGVYPALQAVRGLAAGRSEARETNPVEPVPVEAVEAVLPLLEPPVAAMVRLMDLTAMRVGEVVGMRMRDLDRGDATEDELWTYEPRRHKTAHHGHRRVVLVGAKAQTVLRPFLRADPDALLFQQTRKPRGRWAAAGSSSEARAYTPAVVRRAIQRACAKAGIERWHPHQLRHGAATRLRKRYGLDAARVILGHRSPQMTEVYAELDLDTARRIVAQEG